MFNRFREPVSGLTHLFAAFLSLAGLIVLLVISEDLTRALPLLIYGVSLTAMFTASAVYHLTIAEPGRIMRLRKFDHSAIFVLIAGTYTPICIYFFTGFWKTGLMLIVWGIAVSGVILKIFFTGRFRWVSTGLYLFMGWIAVIAIREILNKMPGGAQFWLLMGGIFFTSGAVIYGMKKPNFIPGKFGFHELWHIFVILGCLSHYLLVAIYIAPFL